MRLPGDSKPHNSHSERIVKAEILSTSVFEKPSRIIVIHSNEPERTWITDLLQRELHTVESVAEGSAGINLAISQKPELVLIDVTLPDMSGFDVCKRLKAHPENFDPSVILLTSQNSPEDHVRGLECGANDFLVKPLDLAIFKARIKTQLKYRRAVNALKKARAELEERVHERTLKLQETNKKLENEVLKHERTEAALKESEQRYALAAQGANDGLWDWNLDNNEIYFSPRWKSMIGFDETELRGSPEEWLSRVHPEDVPQLRADINAHIGGYSASLRSEYRIQHKDGTQRWMLVRGMAVRREGGRAWRIAGSQSDITQRKMAELQLRHDAFHDGLTGLPNRPLFSDRLAQAIARMKRNDKYLFAVLCLDVDRFKIINDSLGHNTGDHLLIEFARRIKRCPRPADTVARLGGDEFAILLDDVKSVEDANLIANRIHEQLKTPFKLQKRDVFVSTSIGIAMGKSRYERPEEVLRDGDTALYQAKAQGLARHKAFSSGMHAQVVTLLDLEHDLRLAVERSEFLLHYQPIISLETGKIVSFEALIRWKHPLRGLVSPAEFIPMAEETEIITPLTMWVLEKACAQLKRWQELFPSDSPLSMSINLSGKTFAQANCAPQIGQVIVNSGVVPGTLKVEITEGTLMHNAEFSKDMLAQLKAMQVELLIDDFGTGYSSLNYLHTLPLDYLKIDRSFVSRLDSAAKNTAMVKTIALLASNLNLKMVAEGVETKDQLAQLRALKCEYAQGYFFSRPVEAEKVESLVASHPQW
jgi:diguanylate cyclase (GGDEF)-like protein/PAS domain S-box-containing protein